MKRFVYIITLLLVMPCLQQCSPHYYDEDYSDSESGSGGSYTSFIKDPDIRYAATAIVKDDDFYLKLIDNYDIKYAATAIVKNNDFYLKLIDNYDIKYAATTIVKNDPFYLSLNK